jgi:hypothetical protein
VSVTEGKRITYRFELEFMSDFGYYRLKTSDTLIVGDHNKIILEKLALEVKDFMKLNPIPDWMGEEKLQESYSEAGKLKSRKKK